MPPIAAGAGQPRDDPIINTRPRLPANLGRSTTHARSCGIVPDPDGITTAGHDNKTARTLAKGEAINAPALRAMFKYIIANNRAGGWRKLKRER